MPTSTLVKVSAYAWARHKATYRTGAGESGRLRCLAHHRASTAMAAPAGFARQRPWITSVHHGLTKNLYGVLSGGMGACDWGIIVTAKTAKRGRVVERFVHPFPA